jgi:hypothetical protein
VKLNTIRNQCAHDWTLHSYRVLKASKTAPARRRYKVEFNGKNLLNPKTMKEEFIPLFGEVYLEFFAANYGLEDFKHRYIDTAIPSRRL